MERAWCLQLKLRFQGSTAVLALRVMTMFEVCPCLLNSITSTVVLKTTKKADVWAVFVLS